MRADMGAKAIALARAVGYRNAGTVEFIVDKEGKFHFLEMNTRLQVEHPVTELVTGLDLVEWMLRIAAGEALGFGQDEVRLDGVAIEARLYAEDPYRHDFPSTGRLRRFHPPHEQASELAVVRIDAGVEEGGEISRLYDPMIGKLIAWGPTREAARGTLLKALDEFEIEGVAHNIPLLSTVLEQERFGEGRLDTGYLTQEFDGGFEGVAPDEERLARLAGLACCTAIKRETRDTQTTDGPSEVRQSVVIGERRFDFTAKSAGDFFALKRPDGAAIEIETGWRPGEQLARMWVGGAEMIVRIDRLTAGFRLRYRGTELVARVLRPEVADLMVHMPPKPTPDVSRLLVCPMPGQVVQIEVAEGEVVEYGQPLAIVEAMKMENVLRAERRARVVRLHVEVGAVLAVDEVIMEFEEA
jgi:propionyl-CoA carboxylase alpha chain